ncbi:MAG: response regulator [Defluviitaleaceae bacterium]|nr:response regulator [Defluviitaleaceae bacterium]MCL2273561.1 response regulator [Defluviitaleaceae bacterium]
MKTIFVVDDNSTNLLTAEKVLSGYYEVITAVNADLMFELLEDITPDLILLDILMPDMDGFEVLKHLRQNPAYVDIPVMFLTAQSDAAIEARGFESGVVDFITKPFFDSVLLGRIRKHLEIEDLIRDRTRQLDDLKNSITYVLADAVENRDPLTGRHIDRTASYVEVLLSALLEKGVYTDELTQWDPEVIVAAARMHDLGKLTISDSILNKPGKLSEAEFEKIKTHTLEGEKIIEEIAEKAGDGEFLRYAKLCAGSHHERWDGTGYPRGLKANEIPLLGRIMAIIDVYDALVSERPYKKAYTHEHAMQIIKENRGTHFDPLITDVFDEIHLQFENVLFEEKKAEG